MAKRTLVEINGRQYDAATGELAAKVEATPAPKAQPQKTQAIDGFSAPLTKTHQRKSSTPRKKQNSSSVHAKPQKTKKLHPLAAKKVTTPKNRN